MPNVFFSIYLMYIVYVKNKYIGAFWCGVIVKNTESRVFKRVERRILHDIVTIISILPPINYH